MASVGEEKDSIKSIRSSSSSGESSERPISAHDYGLDHGDVERSVTPELLPIPLRLAFSNKAASIGTNGTNNPDYEVDWDDDNDPMNPRNWPLWYKGFTIFSISWSTWCIVVYSTSYTTGLGQMQHDFNISSEPLVTLGVTTYRELVRSIETFKVRELTMRPVIGIAIGSVVLAPLSEMYGRRPIYIASMLLFTLLVIPCGLATSLPEVVVVRFFGALAASAMVANSPGTVSDIVDDDYRALAFSIWSIGPFNGPTFGPIIGGFSTQ